MSDIGNIIRKRRTELGMSQRDLALKLKVTPSYISNIERGDQKFPLIRINDFAEILNVDLSNMQIDNLSTSARKVSTFLRTKDKVTEPEFWEFIDNIR